MSNSQTPSRRKLLLPILALAGALVGLLVIFRRQIAAVTFRIFARLLSPRIDITADTVVDAGPVALYRQPGVYSDLQVAEGLWVVHTRGGKLVALRSVCTHLGCTPDWKADLKKFVCPCHGSEYDASGVNIKGPTSRPLERLKIVRVDERIYIDKATAFRQESGQWADPAASIDTLRD